MDLLASFFNSLILDDSSLLKKRDEDSSSSGKGDVMVRICDPVSELELFIVLGFRMGWRTH
jgi:hypothetical protein